MNKANHFLRLLLIVFATLVISQPVEARRFRIFGIPSFSKSETIDLVHDLPNEEPFKQENGFVDVGYLNGRSGNHYVLYNGDRYRKLDAEGLALLTSVLGFDPTAKHKAAYQAEHGAEIAAAAAEAKAEQDHKDKLIAEGRLFERRPGETSAEYAVRKSEFIASRRSSSSAIRANEDSASPAPNATQQSSFGAGTFGIFVLLFLVGGGYALRAFRGSGSSSRAADQQTQPVDHQSFDERVAARLAELQNGGGAEVQTQTTAVQPTHQSAFQQPVARGFGRKIA